MTPMKVSGTMTNEQIAAMAAWTLEDFQNDPLGAMAQIRELAASHLVLQRERDAAVHDIGEAIRESLSANPFRLCKFCFFDDSDDCPLHEDGECIPKWRGPLPEQVLATADQSAGEYADNPVLAQA